MKRFIFIFLAVLIVIPGLTFAGSNPNPDDEDLSSYEVTFTNKDGSDSQTHEIKYSGMVPCGRCLKTTANPVPDVQLNKIHECASDEVFVPCTLCHLFVVFDRIISFILGTLIPALALLVIVFSGVLLITAGLNPKQVKQAQDALTKAAIGFVLSYLAWLIIASVLSLFASADLNLDWSEGGIQVQHMCDVEVKELDLEIEED